MSIFFMNMFTFLLENPPHSLATWMQFVQTDTPEKAHQAHAIFSDNLHKAVRCWLVHFLLEKMIYERFFFTHFFLAHSPIPMVNRLCKPGPISTDRWWLVGLTAPKGHPSNLSSEVCVWRAVVVLMTSKPSKVQPQPLDSVVPLPSFRCGCFQSKSAAKKVHLGAWWKNNNQHASIGRYRLRTEK